MDGYEKLQLEYNWIPLAVPDTWGSSPNRLCLAGYLRLAMRSQTTWRIIPLRIIRSILGLTTRWQVPLTKRDDVQITIWIKYTMMFWCSIFKWKNSQNIRTILDTIAKAIKNKKQPLTKRDGSDKCQLPTPMIIKMWQDVAKSEKRGVAKVKL